MFHVKRDTNGITFLIPSYYLLNPKESLRIFPSMLHQIRYGDSHIACQSFCHIGDILRHIGPRQMESPGRQVWRISFNHHPRQRQNRHRLPQIISPTFIANPAGKPDLEPHIQKRPKRILISCITMHHRQRTNFLMTLEARNKILRRIPFMKK